MEEPIFEIETYETRYGWGWSVNRNSFLFEGCESDDYKSEEALFG